MVVVVAGVRRGSSPPFHGLAQHLGGGRRLAAARHPAERVAAQHGLAGRGAGRVAALGFLQGHFRRAVVAGGVLMVGWAGSFGGEQSGHGAGRFCTKTKERNTQHSIRIFVPVLDRMQLPVRDGPGTLHTKLQSKT